MTTKSPAIPSANAPETYNPTITDWGHLVGESDEILGHDLAKDEILDALVGVPFVITQVTFRPGEAGIRESYVTCECVIGSKEILGRRRVDLALLPFDPGDHVVFNDGSTGIYRQIVAYLHAKGFIALPDPVNGQGAGPQWDKEKEQMTYECSFDLPPTKWAGVHAGDLRYDERGDAIYTVPIRLFAKRGIRISQYENDWTKEGHTRYLA